MRITVDLFADLRRYCDRPSFDLVIDPETTLREIMTEIGVPEDLPVMAVINEMMASLDDKLKDGDRVGLFPPMGGGE